MIIQALGKEINLSYKTRLITQLAERLGCNNLKKHLTQAVIDMDTYTLAISLMVLSDGQIANINEAYDVIDECIAQQDKTIYGLYEDLIFDINDKGFFKAKLSRKALEKELSDPMAAVKMDDIIESAMNQAAAGIMKDQARMQMISSR